MKCEICSNIETKKHVIYEDELAVAFIDDTPSAVAEIIIAPKKHMTILEQVDDETLKNLGVAAKIAGQAAFEALGMDGTNIIINNGIDAGQNIAHFAMSVLPRKKGDGIDVDWSSSQATPESLEQAASQLMAAIGAEKKEEKTESKEDSAKIIKHFRRIP